MADDLDIKVFENGIKFVIVGNLTSDVLSFLREKSPDNNLLNKLCECAILLWDNRIEYTEKHKLNFKSAEVYYNYIKNIPNIIENPDYIGLPPHDDSIQYIKVFDDIIIVAVRISQHGKISYRTMYPITSSQLNDYLRKNRAWKFK